MLKVDKSKWIGSKKEDGDIDFFKDELLNLFKEYCKVTGNNSVLDFLDQSFELLLIIGSDKTTPARIYKIDDLGAAICWHEDTVQLSTTTQNMMMSEMFSKIIDRVNVEKEIVSETNTVKESKPTAKRWSLF